jgi:hypothetical protein
MLKRLEEQEEEWYLEMKWTPGCFGYRGTEDSVTEVKKLQVKLDDEETFPVRTALVNS